MPIHIIVINLLFLVSLSYSFGMVLSVGVEQHDLFPSILTIAMFAGVLVFGLLSIYNLFF